MAVTAVSMALVLIVAAMGMMAVRMVAFGMVIFRVTAVRTFFVMASVTIHDFLPPYIH